ncbi:MAG TPA: FHA domain-containing protein [Burkholderiales bacterium]
MIWVEILSRHHHDVQARHRCPGPVVRIGRGYDNDVVIDDPYVAPRHLVVRRSENGELVAEDLGSANGTLVEPGAERRERVALDGTRVLRIGRTRLRIRDALQAVAPERVLRPAQRTWPATLALIAAVVLLQLLADWLGETTEPRLSRYAKPLLVLPLIVVAWTSAWAVLSRIFAGQAQLGRHLLIAMCGLLAIEAYDAVPEYAAFALSWGPLAGARVAGLWLIIGAVCVFHLRAISPARLRLKAGLVAALAGIPIALQALAQSDLGAGYSGERYVQLLKPPAFRFSALQDESAFFAGTARLKDRLDRARTEDSPADSDDD